jgi:hypothetical protein
MLQVGGWPSSLTRDVNGWREFSNGGGTKIERRLNCIANCKYETASKGAKFEEEE